MIKESLPTLILFLFGSIIFIYLGYSCIFKTHRVLSKILRSSKDNVSNEDIIESPNLIIRPAFVKITGFIFAFFGFLILYAGTSFFLRAIEYKPC